METLLQTIRELKTKAKNRRDLGRYDSAETILGEAISLAQEGLLSSTSTDWKSQLASELSDCYGLLGGIYRRWGLESKTEEERTLHLKKSVDEYQKGYDLEKTDEYNIVNSYNMVNRLVSHILLEPDLSSTLATNPQGSGPLTVRQALQNAEKDIRDQLKEKRRGDIWALADLALVRLLLDEDDPVPAYAEFISKSPPDYAYESQLSTLRPLAELELPVTNKLRWAVQLLEGKLKQLQA
jgi:hypothetical protein